MWQAGEKNTHRIFIVRFNRINNLGNLGVLERATLKSEFAKLNLRILDRLCGLVVRVSGYRYRGPGFDPRRYQVF